MKNANLTKQQLIVMRYIHDFMNVEGRSPTLREVADGIGLRAVSTIHKHIQHLINKGFLDRVHGEGNNIIVVNNNSDRIRATFNNYFINDTQKPQSVVFYGDVAAGMPMLPEANTASLEVPAYIHKGRQELFALRVSGDSMIDDSIVNGDLIVLQRRSNYYNGDRVVALIDNDEVTFKELRRDKNNSGVWLIPHNVNFASQYFSSDRVVVQGALIGIMRNY